MSRLCENCGQPLKDGSRFCEGCGAPVKEQPLNLTCNYDMKLPETSKEETVAETNNDKVVAVGTTVAPKDRVRAEADRFSVGYKEENDPFKKQYENYNRNKFANNNGIYVEDKGFKQKFLRYDNRLNRKRYIIRWLQMYFMVFVAAIVVTTFDMAGGKNMTTVSAAVLLTVMAVATLGTIFLNTRRLHDLGKRGIWGILVVIPYLNFALTVYLMVMKGQEGPNEYGPDPLQNNIQS